MKNTFKKFTSFILVLVLLLGIAPTTVFAGKSDPPATDRKDYSTTAGAITKGNNDDGVFPGVKKALDNSSGTQAYSDVNESYVLSLSIGRKSNLKIKEVMISYYTTDAATGYDAVSDGAIMPYKQFLEVERVERNGYVYSSLSETLDGMWKKPTRNWPYYGSRYGTYVGLLGNQSTVTKVVLGDNINEVGTQSQTKRNYKKYTSIAAAVIAGFNQSAYSTVDNKCGDRSADYTKFADVVTTSGVKANSTEYFRFVAEYNVATIESISFICEQEGVGATGEIELVGWTLWKLTNEASVSATNFSYFSDGLSLLFDNKGNTNAISFVCKSSALSDKKAINTVVYENAVVRYFNPSFMPTGTYNKEKDDVQTYGAIVSKSALDIYKSDINGGTSTDLLTLTFEGGENAKTTQIDTYDFVVTFADEYGAGLEQFNLSPNKDITVYETDLKNTASGITALNLSDVLTADIKYVDIFGRTMHVSLPIISNSILNIAADDVESEEKWTDIIASKGGIFEQISSGAIYQYAQQGDSISFRTDLPNVAEISSIAISYYDGFAAEDDIIGIANVAVYRGFKKEDTTTHAGMIRTHADSYDTKIGDGVVSDVPKTSGKKTEYLLYETSLKATKKMQNGGGAAEMEFVARDGITNTITVNNKFIGQYLIQLTTDNFNVASSNAESYISFTYINQSGETKNTGEYSLRELSQNYMGYQVGIVIEDTRESNAGIIANASSAAASIANATIRDSLNIEVPLPTTHALDVSYMYGTQQGNTLSFTMGINDLKSFSEMKIRNVGTDDDWQIDAVRIEKIEDIGNRILTPLTTKAEYSNTSEDGTVTFETNRTYAREHQGEELYSAKDLDFLVQQNGETSMNFETGASTGTTKLREDYSEYEYSMPYTIATSELKFDTAVNRYTVAVQVGNNSQSASDNDNCGSNNMYYFQLVFAEGKRSGFVLANKQLAADGFRSGFEERFEISVNDDYGDVTGIVIIPDDTTSNADPTDKLCIDTITVTKQNQNSPDKQFTFENIGWIGTSYIDINDTSTKTTRTEAELAYYYSPNYSSYVISLEFEIDYGSLDEYKKDDNDPQFEGNMTCDLTYLTSNGEKKTLTGINMVQLMYDYMNRTAAINPFDSSKIISNKNLMFRENTADRFIVSGIVDCKEIQSIILHADPADSANMYLNIKSIYVNALRQKGTLAFKQDSTLTNAYSYYRKYDPGYEPTLVAWNDSINRAQLVTESSRFIYYFDSAEFPDYETEQSFDYIVEKEPSSSKDSFDMYFYLNEKTPFPSKGGYKFRSGIKYETVNGKVYESVATTMDNDFTEMTIDGKKVLYTQGISASNYKRTTRIWADAVDNITSSYHIDYAIVQRIRAGIVVETTKVMFDSGLFSSKSGTSSLGSNSLKISDNGRQIVQVQLGDVLSDNKVIDPTTRDIAVSLIYTSMTVDGQQYSSPVLFASEASPAALEIHEGSILTFEFNEYDVKNILGIKIQCSGTTTNEYAKFYVRAANVITYKNGTLDGWYSIAPKEDVFIGSSKTLEVTDTCKKFTKDDEEEFLDKLSRVDITLNIESGMTSKLFDTVSGCAVFKSGTADCTYKFTDITQYISNITIPTDYNSAGGTVTLSFMVPGYNKNDDFVKLILEPVDVSDAIGKLYLKSLSINGEIYSIGTGYGKVEATPLTSGSYVIEETTPATITLSGLVTTP